jgi:hypothetical protein
VREFSALRVFLAHAWARADLAAHFARFGGSGAASSAAPSRYWARRVAWKRKRARR